jgi:hypothetical protein
MLSAEYFIRRRACSSKNLSHELNTFHFPKSSASEKLRPAKQDKLPELFRREPEYWMPLSTQN